jgi:hypothetical protein
MTAFFIPGIAGDTRRADEAYAGMRRKIELELGRLPSSRRILSLWTRRGNVDCVTEVGRTDPLRGGTVIAIFDMGRQRPFVVWWQQDSDTHEDAREVLGPHAYSVLEFDT